MNKEKNSIFKQVFKGIIISIGIFIIFSFLGILGLYASGKEWLPRVTKEMKLTSKFWNDTMIKIENKFNDTVSVSGNQDITGNKSFSGETIFKEKVIIEEQISGPNPTNNSDLATKAYVDRVVEANTGGGKISGGWVTKIIVYNRYNYTPCPDGWFDLGDSGTYISGLTFRVTDDNVYEHNGFKTCARWFNGTDDYEQVSCTGIVENAVYFNGTRDYKINVLKDGSQSDRTKAKLVGYKFKPNTCLMNCVKGTYYIDDGNKCNYIYSKKIGEWKYIGSENDYCSYSKFTRSIKCIRDIDQKVVSNSFCWPGSLPKTFKEEIVSCYIRTQKGETCDKLCRFRGLSCKGTSGYCNDTYIHNKFSCDYTCNNDEGTCKCGK